MEKPSSAQTLVKKGELPFKGIFVNFGKEELTWENTEEDIMRQEVPLNSRYIRCPTAPIALYFNFSRFFMENRSLSWCWCLYRLICISLVSPGFFKICFLPNYFSS